MVKMNSQKKQEQIDKRHLVTLLSENYPLLSILIGIALVSATIGPFNNTDTQLEFDAASGVIRWGMPFMNAVGEMINQPPLGFYTEALFLKIFGLSYNTGVALITLIGLGCSVLVYKVGKTLYGKPTALLATALFALTPWQFALSRSYLIDAQCLFFSLFSLLVGIYAVRKDSFRLLMVSAVLFAVAFLTKFFAIFMLIPMALFYFYNRQSKLKRKFVVVAYFLPVLFLLTLWYQLISGRGLISVIGIDDFTNYNTFVSAPSSFFLINFLLNGLGALFLLAVVLSLIVSFVRRRFFSKFLAFDLMCVITILVVGSVNTLLAVGLNCGAPYMNPIKYNYQSLPFFSLLTASLVGKSLLLFDSVKLKEKWSKLLFSVAVVGLILLAAAMFLNMNWVNEYSTWDHWLFKVESDQNIGYAFLNPHPISKGSSLMGIQYLGFAVVLSGFLWAGRKKLGWLRELLYNDG
jgi:4-amino-4-deoxy-L-arabinose transferase-like glycosyltransferase